MKILAAGVLSTGCGISGEEEEEEGGDDELFYCMLTRTIDLYLSFPCSYLFLQGGLQTFDIGNKQEDPK